MSGRGRGRGRGRYGGRGRGRGSYKGRGTNNNTSNNKIYKFAPKSAGKGNYATYTNVKDRIINQIQKNYDYGHDTAVSLRNLEKLDLSSEEPTLKVSTSSDDATKDSENAAFKVQYEIKMTAHIERENKLRDNLARAYALIIENYCTDTLVTRIEQLPDFESTIRDDPIELLKAIQGAVASPVRAQYPFASLTAACKDVLNMKQNQDEKLLDYTNRFKQNWTVFKSNIGSKALDSFIEQTEEYKMLSTETGSSAKETEMKEGAMEAWKTYLFVANSDPAKYGSIPKNLSSRFSMGHDEYPRTFETAIDILSNHRLDNRSVPRERQTTPRNNNSNNNDGNPNSNNRTNEDDDPQSRRESSFAQREITCYCCGEEGHTSPECPKRNSLPREQWYVNRALQNLQADEADSVSDTTNEPSSQQQSSGGGNRRRNTSRNQQQDSWHGFQCGELTESCEHQHNQHVFNDEFKTSFCLDSGSGCNTASSTMLVRNIRKSNKSLNMGTNNGAKKLNQECDIPGLDDLEVWFNEGGICTVLSLGKMSDQYHITYDNAKEDAFLVQTKNGIVKFERTDKDIYAFRPSEQFLKRNLELNTKQQSPEQQSGVSNWITTLKENKEGFTARQIERAKAARKLLHIVGAPTVADLKAVLRQNLIKNCTVTHDDLTLAEKIFGPDVSVLKGKSTRPRRKPVREDRIDIPPEIKEQRLLELCVDIMNINGVDLFTSIDRTIKYRGVSPIDNKQAEEFLRALASIVRHYLHAGYLIKMIYCDNAFKPLTEKLSDHNDLKGIALNTTNADDHVPEAERNNRTIAERFRTAYHRMPYKHIPRVMIRALAMVCAQQLNLFPPKGGVSQYYSPHMILTERSWDYKKHCQVPFGAYVQASHESDPSNTNDPRTIDAIYLRPIKSMQGGHEVMDLNSGRMVTRYKVTECPVTPLVIKAVEAMAAKQNIKSLKFKNRHGVIFHPADWIAGVDYEEDEDPNDEDYIETNADDDDYGDDDDFDDDSSYYDRVDPNELDDLERERSIPIVETVDEDDSDDEDDDDDNDDVDEAEEEQPAAAAEAPRGERYSTRNRTARVLLDPNPSKKSYDNAQTAATKRVRFADEEFERLEHCHNLIPEEHPNPDEDVEYDPALAFVIAQVIVDLNSKFSAEGLQFAQQYILQKGLKVFKDRGWEASYKELDQLHRRVCFGPIAIKDLTPEEKKKAMEALMFLTEKRDGTVKGRMVYNGKPTREWLSREDSSSPTVMNESTFLTATVDAKENRDVMSFDVPNAFIQTLMPETNAGDERIIMKITGVLVDILVQLSPETYGPYVVFENNRKVLYVVVLRAIYGMLQAALLWYQKFKRDLEDIGFKFNPYDPCVANRKVHGSQQTVLFHVDDGKSSHRLKKVNDEFERWLNHKYGDYGKVKAVRGKKHDFLGMILDFSEKGKVKIDMTSYVSQMVDEFPVDFGPDDVQKTPAASNLFAEGEGPELDKKRKEQFHTTVAKGLFICKRARPDIHPTIAVLCTRVQSPKETDWERLIRLLEYLNGTRNDILTLSADDLHIIKWFVDAAFAVHPDFKSHTGGIMTYGRGAAQSLSRKHKINTRSSTEAELVGADDASQPILWTKLFMEAQGYAIHKNILYQDNKSTILLEVNGKRSSSKRTRALNIRYFFLTDQVEKGNLTIQYCPTDKMIGDFMSKPLQGSKFLAFKKQIMGQD